MTLLMGSSAAEPGSRRRRGSGAADAEAPASPRRRAIGPPELVTEGLFDLVSPRT